MYVITVPHITLLIWVNKRIELKIWIELRCWNLSKTYLSYNLSQWYYFEPSISYLWISLELKLCGMNIFIFFLVNIIGDFRVQLADVRFHVVVDGQTVNVRQHSAAQVLTPMFGISSNISTPFNLFPWYISSILTTEAVTYIAMRGCRYKEIYLKGLIDDKIKP